MSKELKITANDGTEYTLGFTRKTIELMEKQGFNIGDLANKPMTTLPALFRGAFYVHHRNVDQKTVDEILYHIKDKETFIEKLAEMYNEPLLALLDEPAETEGNAKWEASW